VRFKFESRTVYGVATLTVIKRDPSVKTLRLDAIGFTLLRVADGNNKRIEHRYDGDALYLTLEGAVGTQYTVEIEYFVTPTRGLYFFFPNEHKPKRPVQVWTQCQDEDARYWIPCHDYPNMRMSTEFIVDAPQGWHVLSNGTLLSRTTIDGTHGMDPALLNASGKGLERWHWSQKEPHVAYLMTLVAGHFAEINADMPDLSVRYYADPSRIDDAQRTFARTPAMITQFEKLTGVKFPWAKYHQIAVVDFTFGGMENTSATTMTDRILLDARAALDNSSDDIVAHELAHQWFGDLVTCRDWSHAWLNEGFATFMEHVDAEHKDGKDEYRYSLEEHAQGYFGEDGGRYRRPIVCSTYANPIDLFDRHLYEKGGWVLHMLRCELGDELFWGGVKRYLDKHRGGIVETRDLLRAMEEQSGRSLEGFFDQWVFKAGHPELEVEATHDAEHGLLLVKVAQKQSVDAVTPLFRLSLEVAVIHGTNETRHKLQVSEDAQVFVLPCAKVPSRVVIDPDGTILATWSLKLARDWLLDAMKNDQRAVVRWRAAQALVKRDEPEVVAALTKTIMTDGFWGVRVEAANVLGEMNSQRAYDALVSCVGVGNHKARRAVVAALGGFKTKEAAKLLAEKLSLGDESVLVEGELARSAGRTKQTAIVWDALKTALTRDSWRDYIRACAIDGIARLRAEEGLPLVEVWTGPAQALGTRRTAVMAMAELGYKDRAVRERLEALIDLNEPYFTPELFRALVRFGDAAAVGSIQHAISLSNDGRVKRHGREAARALSTQKGPQDELRRLQDSVELLQNRTREFEEQLAKLKAANEAPSAAKRGAKKSAKSRKRTKTTVKKKR
jgi:aminopeptidase N